MSAPSDAREQGERRAPEELKQQIRRFGIDKVARFATSRSDTLHHHDPSSRPFHALFHLSESTVIKKRIARPISRGNEGSSLSLFAPGGGLKTLNREAQARVIRDIIGKDFPEPIWQCCKRRCFAQIAIQFDNAHLFAEILWIHSEASRLADAIEYSPSLVQARRRSIGGSSMLYVNPTRAERPIEENIVDPSGTDRITRRSRFKAFCISELPFLKGLGPSSRGVDSPSRALCLTAIRHVLCVSLQFLYRRCKNGSLMVGDDERLISIVDTTGIRERQHRKNGSRQNYPRIDELESFACGCDNEPCFRDSSCAHLEKHFNQFAQLAKAESSRHKENMFLLDVMYHPLTNSVIGICNTALSALYTVSRELIADVRCVLHRLCTDTALISVPLREDGRKIYRSTHHPVNRLPQHIRDQVEQFMDLFLRPDPGASEGKIVLCVYDPEINTHEKLLRTISGCLEADCGSEPMSASTLQRMIQDILAKKGCRISFFNSDHNACPLCKQLQFALLEFHWTTKLIEKDIRNCQGESNRADELQDSLEGKQFQEQEVERELLAHLARDASIRTFLKELQTVFRRTENDFREAGTSREFSWRDHPNHALLTHQDDMSKVDLPSIVIEASSDITRWRFDVNAHVSAVTDHAVVFSHEQGGGAKNSSAILEMILVEHLINCRGEGIKIVVSDCAAVGRSWMTTVCLPQYFVDQGLASIVLMVFLENNHGKYLADLLFGQFQRRRLRSTIVGIDALLSEFESLNRSGGVSGFAMNPLSSVDFGGVLESLGYCTKPPKAVMFAKRNVHFAAACRPGAKDLLSDELMDLLGCALPDDEGMVRLSHEPPNGRRTEDMPLESRYIDVPAADLHRNPQSLEPIPFKDTPLVVPIDQPYAASGNGLVSTRTATHVGYNGFAFRGKSSNPELNGCSTRLVREAWPPSMIDEHSDNGINPAVDFACAPDNWVLRKPVRHFAGREVFKARYPPKNIRNALAKQGPRVSTPWVPTATYWEPLFPNIPNTSAYHAVQLLQEHFQDLSTSPCILNVLGFVYYEMGDREGVKDSFLQRQVSRPPTRAVKRYRDIEELMKKRQQGHPAGPRGVRAFFKDDSTVKQRVDDELRRSAGLRLQSETVDKVSNRLFAEAEFTPGALTVFKVMAERDLERYAKELKVFTETTQATFDIAHKEEIEGLYTVRRRTQVPVRL